MSHHSSSSSFTCTPHPNQENFLSEETPSPSTPISIIARFKSDCSLAPRRPGLSTLDNHHQWPTCDSPINRGWRSERQSTRGPRLRCGELTLADSNPLPPLRLGGDGRDFRSSPSRRRRRDRSSPRGACTSEERKLSTSSPRQSPRIPRIALPQSDSLPSPSKGGGDPHHRQQNTFDASRSDTGRPRSLSSSGHRRNFSLPVPLFQEDTQEGAALGTPVGEHVTLKRARIERQHKEPPTPSKARTSPRSMFRPQKSICFVWKEEIPDQTGSLAKLYRVRDARGDVFALKDHDLLHGRRGLLQHALREQTAVEVFADRNHPHIISLYHCWEERGHFYVQMELMDSDLGKFTSEQAMRARDHQYDDECTIREDLVWDMLTDILLALDFLNSLGYVHLDVKPENILYSTIASGGGTCVDSSGDSGCSEEEMAVDESTIVFKLSDFGTLFVINDVGRKERPLDSGDGNYQPPEFQSEDGPSGERIKCADVFSLGWTAFEMATFMSVPKSEHKWSGTIDPSIESFYSRSPQLQSIILQMIQPDPLKRPTAGALLTLPTFKEIIDARMASGRYTKPQRGCVKSHINPREEFHCTPVKGGRLRQSNRGIRDGRTRLSLGTDFTPTPLIFPNF